MDVHPFITYGLLGLTFGFAGGLSPGPITALVVSQTLRFGRREGYKVSLAPIITDGPLLLVAMYLADLAQGFQTVTASISLIGSCVLVWLAYDTGRAGQLSTDLDDVTPGSVGKAVLTNLTNPHPYVFWITIGAPTALDALNASVTALIVFVGAFAVSIVGAKVAIAYGIDRYRTFFEGPAYRWTMRGLAFLLLALAVQFGFSGITTLLG